MAAALSNRILNGHRNSRSSNNNNRRRARSRRCSRRTAVSDLGRGHRRRFRLPPSLAPARPAVVVHRRPLGSSSRRTGSARTVAGTRPASSLTGRRRLLHDRFSPTFPRLRRGTVGDGHSKRTLSHSHGLSPVSRSPHGLLPSRRFFFFLGGHSRGSSTFCLIISHSFLLAACLCRAICIARPLATLFLSLDYSNEDGARASRALSLCSLPPSRHLPCLRSRLPHTALH